MNYGSVSRVSSRFPPISSVSALSSAYVALVMEDVESEIHAIIGKRYTVPVTGSPPLLAGITERETIYRVVTDRALIQFPPPQEGQHPLQVRHKEDMATLMALADGSRTLVDSGGNYIAPDSTQIEVWTNTKDYNPTFHEGDTLEQGQDTEKLTDITDDRRNRT